jgi:hypothetical protein
MLSNRRVIDFFLTVLLCCWIVIPARAQIPIIEDQVPKITWRSTDGVLESAEPNQVAAWEMQLYRRYQYQHPPMDTYALYEERPGSGTSRLIEVLVYDHSAELRLYPDDCTLRFFIRKLDEEELKSFVDFIKAKNVDQLPEYQTNVCDGVIYSYIHFTKDGGYRVAMNNPPVREELREFQDDSNRSYCELISWFARICTFGKWEIRYVCSRLIPGLEILYANPTNEIRTVWAEGDDVRVLVGQSGLAGQKWYALRETGLEKEVDCPDVFSAHDVLDRANDNEAGPFGLSYIGRHFQPWQATAEGRYVLTGVMNGQTKGTWLCTTTSQPVRIFNDNITDYLLTPNGHWLVGSIGTRLICYDFIAQKMVPIENPDPAKTFYALYYLPQQEKVLLISPTRGEAHFAKPVPKDLEQFPADYRLLDPRSGKTTAIEHLQGSMPLRQRTDRPFQPTQKVGVVWTATKEKGYSIIGQFDTASFQFKPWTQVDSIEFESNDMWIDESLEKVYIVYRGQLLRIPLGLESQNLDTTKNEAEK